MERLPAADLRRLLAFLAELAGADRDALPEALLGGLQRLIPCDSASYNAVDPDRAHNAWLVAPADAVPPAMTPRFDRHLGEHPVIAHYARTGDGQALRLADFLSQRQLHRLGLYAEVYHPLRIEHQLAVAVPAPPPAVVGLALSRARRPFTERERALLELARPHLAAAYREAGLRSLLRRGLAAAGIEAVELGAGGAVGGLGEGPARLLGAYLGGGPGAGRRLPPDLAEWVRRRQADRPGAAAAAPFVAAGPGGWLVARFVAGGTGGAADLLLLSERAAGVAPARLAGQGLSRREAQVLAELAAGRSNAEIAAALGIRPGTVEKHLAHLYAKLGVPNRAAAVAWALRVTGRDR